MNRTAVAALACTIAASTVAAPEARAQLAFPLHLGVSGGVSVPTSDAIDQGSSGGLVSKSKTGYNVNGLLSLQVPLFPLGLRAEVGYDKFNGEDSPISGAGGRSDVSVLAGTLNAIVQTTGVIVARPYLIGGVGMYRVKRTTRVDDGDILVAIDDKKTSFGLNGGVGIHFGLGGLGAFAEARYHYVMNDESCGESEACFTRKNTSFVPISVGVMF